MELEGSRLAVGCGNGKLRQWLIDQIDSRIYSGLVWENEQKSVFRIPWKHAGKQDYNRDEDAALFKAWALFKGKFKEGVDKPDPPTWKTRLRCALNKSNDFDELVERSQLDISEPYKVYRIIPEGAKKGVRLDSLEDTRPHGNAMGYIPSYSFVQNQVSSYMLSQDRKDWMDQQPLGLPSLHHGRHAEQQFVQGHDPSPLSRPHWTTPHPENVGFQVSGSFYSCSTESQAAAFTVDHSGATSDFSLHVSLFYRESLVKEVTTTSPKGCRITSCSPSSPPSSSSSSSSSTSPSPSPEERLCAGAEVILFPFPYPESQRRGAEKLPDVLERGVLLWMAPDGLYATRLCQGRVYWEGPLAPHQDRPNKLEKDQTCKLFDTQQFLSELQEFAHYGCRLPRHEVVLCFGDEYPNPQRQRKMITAQVEPVFAKKLLCHYKGYDPIQQDAGMALHFPNQRSLQHIQ